MKRVRAISSKLPELFLGYLALLIAAIVLCLAMVWRPSSNPTVRVIQDRNGPSQVYIAADHSLAIWPFDCVTVDWQVDPGDEIFLNDQPVAPAGQNVACGQNEAPVFRVVFPDKSIREYPLGTLVLSRPYVLASLLVPVVIVALLAGLRRRRATIAFSIAVLALCAVAFAHAVRATGDLEWPYDVDQYREIGMAQTLLDGKYGTDLLYQGETIWYNPLVSIIIANLTRLTGLPPNLVTTRLGAYLNLAAPIAFYILMAYFFDRWIALACMAAFLFAYTGSAPSWAAASYSPWTFGENFVQALFYVTLAAYRKALVSRLPRWYVTVGVLLGLTFLGHTAPAVILGVVIVVASLTGALARWRGGLRAVIRAPEVWGAAVIVLIAFCISLPFSFSILGHYHLTILNTAPSNWMYAPLAAENWPAFVNDQLTAFNLVAAVGLIALVFAQRTRYVKVLLLTWLIACCLEIGLNFLQQVADLPLDLMFVPAYHFLFYLTAAEVALFGYGLVSGCRFLVRRLAPRVAAWYRWLAKDDRRGPRMEAVLIASGIISFLFLAFPAYPSRLDFTYFRQIALDIQGMPGHLEAYHWILQNTRPDDVFLVASGHIDLYIVGPAGRKVVVSSKPEFSNPYVPLAPRAKAAARMLDDLKSGAADAFEVAAAPYHVTYVISNVNMANLFDRQSSSFLVKEFESGDVRIYAVQPKSSAGVSPLEIASGPKVSQAIVAGPTPR